MSSSKRHFTAVVGSKEHGLYNSSSPSSAARKIVSKLCASSKSKKVEFCVREITQGSKKKTYGPYLGEMKKLAKPIELKGRVIRYAPVAHLKKKKTASKTVIKLGKKMRGGDIDTDGILTKDDFLITDVRIVYEQITSNIVIESNSSIKKNRSFLRYSIIDFDTILPCRLKIKNDRFQEPFIFFGKTIYGESKTINTIKYYDDFEPIVHYEYVAFNKGFPPFKTAGFKKVNIRRNGLMCYYDFPDVDNILEISIEALKQLRDFLFKQRRQYPSFCNTIYTAVVELTGPPEQ